MGHHYFFNLDFALSMVRVFGPSIFLVVYLNKNKKTNT